MFQDEPADERFRQAKSISELMNLGPTAEKQFAAAGIKSAAQFRQLGWQKTMKKLVACNPKHRHSLYAYAIIGALQNIIWNKIPEMDKAAARAFCAELKSKPAGKVKNHQNQQKKHQKEQLNRLSDQKKKKK